MKTMEIYVQPGAKETAIVGMHGEKLKIKIAAPAQDDQANQKLIEFLAKHFAVPKKNIEIIRGVKSRHKVVRFTNCP